MPTIFISVDKTKTSVQRQQLCDTLNRDLQCIQEWGQRWLVSFNSSKTKGLLHSRSRDRSQRPCLQMSGSNLVKQQAISLLGLTACSDLSWRQYLQSIFKQASQRVGCLYRASRFLHPQTILYLYKSTVRPIMEYCCHLWAGAPRTHLDPLDRVERRVKNLVGQAFSEEFSFFIRTSQMWNRLPKSVFPEKYDISSFKRRVNRFLMDCQAS